MLGKPHDPNILVFARFFTVPLTHPNGEVGEFEFWVETEKSSFLPLLDKPGFIKATLASQLVHCVKSTSVPIEKWNAEFSPDLQREHGYPAGIAFASAKQRGKLL